MSVHNRHAFTLIEVLIVVALIATVCAFSLMMSGDDYRGVHFRSAQSTIVAALMHARAEAITNECFGDDCTTGRAHGVKVFDDSVVVFQVDAASSTHDFEHRDAEHDEITQLPTAVAVASSSVPEILFDTQTGDAIHSGTLTITERGSTRSFDITVAPNGKIDW